MREVEEWPNTAATFRNLQEWTKSPRLPEGRTVVLDGLVPIHYSLEINEGGPLVVVLQGAKTPAIKLPYLGGANVTAGLGVSKLFVSDPSLYLSEGLNLAWYAGSRMQPKFQDFLVSLVKRVAAQTSASRTVLVGGSGGGFAAAKTSCHMDGSVAVVWNPQTNIEKYNEEHVQNYFDTCWGGNRDEAKSLITTSLLDLYHSTKVNNTILYMQSATDTWHIQDHMKPFVEVVEGRGVMKHYVSDWGRGHIPPPKEKIVEAIQLAISEDLQASAVNAGFIDV